MVLLPAEIGFGSYEQDYEKRQIRRGTHRVERYRMATETLAAAEHQLLVAAQPAVFSSLSADYAVHPDVARRVLATIAANPRFAHCTPVYCVQGWKTSAPAERAAGQGTAGNRAKLGKLGMMAQKSDTMERIVEDLNDVEQILPISRMDDSASNPALSMSSSIASSLMDLENGSKTSVKSEEQEDNKMNDNLDIEAPRQYPKYVVSLVTGGAEEVRSTVQSFSGPCKVWIYAILPNSDNDASSKTNGTSVELMKKQILDTDFGRACIAPSSEKNMPIITPEIEKGAKQEKRAVKAPTVVSEPIKKELNGSTTKANAKSEAKSSVVNFFKGASTKVSLEPKKEPKEVAKPVAEKLPLVEETKKNAGVAVTKSKATAKTKGRTSSARLNSKDSGNKGSNDKLEEVDPEKEALKKKQLKQMDDMFDDFDDEEIVEENEFAADDQLNREAAEEPTDVMVEDDIVEVDEEPAVVQKEIESTPVIVDSSKQTKTRKKRMVKKQRTVKVGKRMRTEDYYTEESCSDGETTVDATPVLKPASKPSSPAKKRQLPASESTTSPAKKKQPAGKKGQTSILNFFQK